MSDSLRAPVNGFMCRTDWEDELGHASDGNKVYPSVEALKRHSPCWEQCGIMEVRVSAERVIDKGNLYGPHDPSPD